MRANVVPAIACLLGVVLASGLLAQDQPKEQAKPQPVDFRKLKELMPETLAGLRRTDAGGEKVQFGDFAVSMANADYSGPEDQADAPQATVQISDYGANPEMAAAIAAWSQIELDRESDDGYQRTSKIDGHPAMEQYDNEGKTGELQIFVAGRFIVAVTTTNLPSEQLGKIAESLPLAELAAMK